MSAIPGFGNVRFSYGKISLFNARCFPAEQFAGSTFASSKKEKNPFSHLDFFLFRVGLLLLQKLAI